MEDKRADDRHDDMDSRDGTRRKDSIQDIEKRKIFIGGLARETTEQELEVWIFILVNLFLRTGRFY